MGNLTEIDRLIEAGLALYGLGDLDGALDSWEQALEIDPDNAQANSYVEYVRQNYEMLNAEVTGETIDPASTPYPISEDDYQVEILPGEAIPATMPDVRHAPMMIDPTDAGWFIEDDSAARRVRRGNVLAPPAPKPQPPQDNDDREVEMELITEEAPEPETPMLTFEEHTREYPGGPIAKKSGDFVSIDPITTEFRVDDNARPTHEPPQDFTTPPGGFAQLTPGFETTTSGFGSQVTDIRKRDTGFVQPAQPPQTPPPEAFEPPRRRTSQPPELKMTLRSPRDGDDDGDDDGDYASPPDYSPPPASSEIELSYDDPPDASDSDARDLIESLPSPTPAPSYGGLRDGLMGRTQDFPPATRKPAAPSKPPPISPAQPIPVEPSRSDSRDFPSAQTAELPGVRFHMPASKVPTRDLPEPVMPAVELPPLVSSTPTRDLGLRAQAALTPVGTPTTPAPGDEEPTKLRRPRENDQTTADAMLAFDPIDARSALILDEIDRGSPQFESKEDKTRRRITSLFERALDWSRGSEIDRAVAAIDLALNEDPNSALAQKLIHRNRETMTNVFQQFLGDLNRQPILAKPLHELAAAPISPRAAFLLSRVDGTLSLDEILDVSGMPRLEAYRYLCQLFLRGILR